MQGVIGILAMPLAVYLNSFYCINREAVSAYVPSKQILPFGLVEQCFGLESGVIHIRRVTEKTKLVETPRQSAVPSGDRPHHVHWQRLSCFASLYATADQRLRRRPNHERAEPELLHRAQWPDRRDFHVGDCPPGSSPPLPASRQQG